MGLFNQIIALITQFAKIGGGLWLLWGAVVAGGGMKDHNGPQMQSGIWQIAGGGLILGAAALFSSISGL
ncbi:MULTISPECIES: hypothetical protein [Enterococcus]|nr:MULTISPECIES: hypothetical protein [Enterococcus]EOU09390.1 hypothetical protein I588_05236 [Enterococcus pallens ATCC BAA-351]MBO1340282.1 hypothetical protein [Enterococcus sp. 665A]OJG76430.1 hypothetical protein RV10_GL003758 [Enterococcus pallens]